MTPLFENPLLLLLAVATAGLLLGRVRLAGVSLGTSGVVFAALAAGHFGVAVSPGAGRLGLVLFVYCVGLAAGPGFFRTFRRKGREMASLSALLVASGALAAGAAAVLIGLPPDLAAGVFAGALTSTPGLAAALEASPGGGAAVAYGLAYPVGLIAIVAFVQTAPRLLATNLARLGAEEAAAADDGDRIVRRLVEVLNPAVEGRRISAVDAIAEANCQISRVFEDGRLRPVDSNFALSVGQKVLLIGRKRRIGGATDFLGREVDPGDLVLDAESDRMQVVVGSKEVVDKTLRELRFLGRFGVTVSRIQRHGVELVPRAADAIEYGDALTAVGEREDLERFAEYVGHRARIFDETDLISVGIGLMAGIAVGLATVELGEMRIGLGLAGGPLLVGLLLGHFGRVGPIKGHLPRAARMLMQETGLILFLASAGAAAGSGLAETLAEFGPRLLGAALLTVIAPLAAGYVFGRRVFGLTPLETLGAVCGGMTSTPGLGAITSQTDADAPVVSYAAAYPAALILMTVLAKALVRALGG